MIDGQNKAFETRRADLGAGSSPIRVYSRPEGSALVNSLGDGIVDQGVYPAVRAIGVDDFGVLCLVHDLLSRR